jgi:hypothetical protein
MMPFLLLSVSLAQTPLPNVKLPTELRASPGRIVQLKAETSEKNVRWYLVTEDADLVPFPEGKIALFSAPKAGRYTVLAWTAAGDVPSDAAKCIIIVGDAIAPPVADPWLRDFQKLFHEDSSSDKASHLAQLAALYREAIQFTDKTDIATVGDLAARIRTAAGALVPADSLVAVRKRIAEMIAKELPGDGDQPLDSATRTKAAKLFGRLATLLEDIK